MNHDERGIAHLGARIALVEERVHALIAHRRSDDPAPDDPFRGLYLGDDMIDWLLRRGTQAPARDPTGVAAVEEAADATEAAGARLPLRSLARAAGLTDVDVELLVIALIPDLDGRFERLYGYLNDDVTRRRASIGLAFEVIGVSPASAAARGRIAGTAPLVEFGLVEVEDPDRPLLSRALRVPDRVAAHLLGDDGVDPALAGVLSEARPHDGPPVERLSRALDAGVRLVHIRELSRGTGASAGLAALRRTGRDGVQLDLTRLVAEPDPVGLTRVAVREALLRGGGVIAGPIDALAAAAPAALRRLADAPVPVLTYGTSSWDPTWSDVVPLLTESTLPSAEQRAEIWREHLADDLGHLDSAATAHFVLGPTQVARAVAAARSAALLAGAPADADDLRSGARAQNAAGLERLSRRIEPEVAWSDLVLPDVVLNNLRDLATRARHRETVLNQWRMRPGGGRGNGITALFAGDSGTGKTMSAEAIAGELGLDLYTVNLATVIDKYVGETEKNLERIFAEASGVNAVLLFDEADAIFGKRSEVRDAHDRYANIESAYLLQRMETFDGLAVLATNLRANIDEAFTRRLDAIIDFPEPSESLRLELWRRCLAAPVPVADDVDLEFCARAFALTGGNIRSIAITAGYRAAASGQPISMADVIAAVQQEYRKLGRLVVEQEFGSHFSAPKGVRQAAGSP
ncbi:MAG TPA: ATP-binding protein [Jatrophihabitans sp.]|nr:ATP-binding protein [Jatrophihabitans sp.]